VIPALLRRLVFRLRYLRARPRLESVDECDVLGFRLRIEPGVFHAGLFPSSQFLARFTAEQELGGRHVLDMGTGSGIVGLAAARAGARVVAADVSSAAVECARVNARRNGLGDQMEIVESDLFDGLGGRQPFDDIFWNPPFYPKPRVDAADRAWNAGQSYGTIAAFAREAPRFLAANGRIVLVLSSDMELELVRSFFTTGAGLAGRVVATERGLFETLTVEEFARPRPHQGLDQNPVVSGR